MAARAGGPWKLNSQRRCTDTHLPFLCGRATHLLNNLRNAATSDRRPATTDHLRRRRTSRPVPIREDVWRSINLSARECKEDWFPTGLGAGERGGIEFRPESTIEVVFVIFLTYVARSDVTILPIGFIDLELIFFYKYSIVSLIF